MLFYDVGRVWTPDSRFALNAGVTWTRTSYYQSIGIGIGYETVVGRHPGGAGLQAEPVADRPALAAGRARRARERHAHRRRTDLQCAAVPPALLDRDELLSARRDLRHGTPAPAAPLYGMTAPPSRIFLLSPAHSGGKRAALLLGGRGRFALAERLRAGGTITLAEAFTFLSGLYFRGKLAYARRFARPPAGIMGVAGHHQQPRAGARGHRGHGGRAAGFADTEIRPDEPRYRDPLRRDLAALDEAVMAGEAPPEVVLLGSVATGKYVDVLLDGAGRAAAVSLASSWAEAT